MLSIFSCAYWPSVYLWRSVCSNPLFIFFKYSKFPLAIYFTYGNISCHVTLSIHLTLSSPLPKSSIHFLTGLPVCVLLRCKSFFLHSTLKSPTRYSMCKSVLRFCGPPVFLFKSIFTLLLQAQKQKPDSSSNLFHKVCNFYYKCSLKSHYLSLLLFDKPAYVQ